MTNTAPAHTLPESPERVLRFWRDAGYDRWFASDPTFDRIFREHFLAAHMAAARRELDAWLGTAEGCLALLILLDQFPRNAFRGTGHMYATDPLAVFVARHMLARGFDQAIDEDMRAFCYLPFEHAEDLADQDLSVRLFEALGGAFMPMRASIGRSSSASGASRTATESWAARRRRTSGRTWQKAVSQDSSSPSSSA